jgi:hypothetical protein
MSGPFSRFLVIFYPLSPRTPFKNVCHHTLKAFLGSLSFDNNGLVKPSCGTVAIYDPFGVF